MWVLHIHTESGEHYYAIAEYELSEESTTIYIKNRFHLEIEDLLDEGYEWEDYFFWEWVEVDVIAGELEDE